MKAINNNYFNVSVELDQTLIKCQMIIWSMRRQAVNEVVEFCRERDLFNPDTLKKLDLILYPEIIKRLQSLSPDYLGRVNYNLLNSLLGYYFKITYFEKYCLGGSYKAFLKFAEQITGSFGVSNSMINQDGSFKELCILAREASIHPKIKKLLEVTDYLKSHHKTVAIICEPVLRKELRDFLINHGSIIEDLKKASVKRVNNINIMLFTKKIDIIFLDHEKDLDLLFIDSVVYYQIPKIIDYKLNKENKLLKFFLFLTSDKRLYENEFKNNWKRSLENLPEIQLSLF